MSPLLQRALRISRRWLAAGWLGALAGPGCSTPPCDTAINPNHQRYTTSIGSLYDINQPHLVSGDSYAGTGASCQGMDGLAEGATLSLETIGSAPADRDSCRNAVAQLTSAPAQVTIVQNETSNPTSLSLTKPADVMYALTQVTVGGCSGTLLLEFFAGPDNLFAPVDGGPFPPGVMYRLFYPTDASCMACEDNFVVHLAAGGTGAGSD